MKVWVVVHDDIEHSEVVGVYATEAAARRAVEEHGAERLLRELPKFSPERERAFKYHFSHIEEWEVQSA